MAIVVMLLSSGNVLGRKDEFVSLPYSIITLTLELDIELQFFVVHHEFVASFLSSFLSSNSRPIGTGVLK
jgi:hypothetical protein